MSEPTRLERLVIALLNSPIKQWEAQAELQMGYAGAIVDRALEFEREMDKESGSKPASVNGWSRERFREELSRQLLYCGLSIDCNSLAETLARVFYDSRKLTTRDIGPEPAPDELPIMDERRVIMTRVQFGQALTDALNLIESQSRKTGAYRRYINVTVPEIVTALEQVTNE